MPHRLAPGRLLRARLILALMAGGLFVLGPWAAIAVEPATKVDYSRDIRPILANVCFACHGPDANKRQADLRLDLLTAAGKKVLSPGNAAASELLRRVGSKDPDEQMPPPDSKKPRLTVSQIELLRRWIDQGAKYEVHWAYNRPSRPPLPAAKGRGWALGPIDCFVAQAQDAHGLKPAAAADRRTLLRRLTLDLVGLPPAPTEIDAFLADRTSGAYEREVDRLLASPHYGERMAVYWLDLVRYGDTCGYHSDNPRDVWLYRDWVIEAFNRNVPFDRFTIEQLAGDLLPNPTRDQKIASGYNRLLMTTEEGGAQPKEYAAKFAADRVRNASSAWLGSTMGCCQCHDHKYDPFSARDFYSLGAFFADVKEHAVGRQVQTPMPTAEQAARLHEFDRQIAAQPQSAKKKLAELKHQKEKFEETLPTTLITESVAPKETRILPRGNWMDDSGEIVAPAIPAFLGKLETGGRRANRLDLAHWFVSADNPLVARVFVNRLWKQFFGQGLVKSLDDYGTQGALPTHPELLNWLAVEFRESGWDVKRLVRLIVTSQTYRQSSEAEKAIREQDPMNQWLTRQGSFRLEAEFVRDNALAASGLLSRKIGGPSVKPYQPAGYWSFLNFPPREYTADTGENQYRRGLYTFWQRTFVHPSLLAFDASTREECAAERARSNTPLQSLVLLNDPTYVEAARALAARMIREGGATSVQRLRFAYLLTIGREPRPAEIRTLTGLYEKHRNEYATNAKAAESLVAVGQSPPSRQITPGELAAFTSVARVILNLHETITRN